MTRDELGALAFAALASETARAVLEDALEKTAWPRCHRRDADLRAGPDVPRRGELPPRAVPGRQPPVRAEVDDVRTRARCVIHAYARDLSQDEALLTFTLRGTGPE